jgi:hypothetical protein
MNRDYLMCNRAVPLAVEPDGRIGNDGWVHIVPKGELPNKESGVVQVLDDQALDAILKNLQAEHGKANSTGLYMGHEHDLYNPDKSSAAYAWPKQFEKRDNGIWANVAPATTDIGADALGNNRFKWTSFCADPATPGAVENLGNNRMRILKIDSVGFTNFPNGRGLLSPVNNRESGTADDSGREENALARQATLQREVQDYKIKNRCTFEQAFNAIRRTKPGLFNFNSANNNSVQSQSTMANRLAKNPYSYGFAKMMHSADCRSLIFQTMVGMVQNRLGSDYTGAYRAVYKYNADMLEKPSAELATNAQSFTRLLNRATSVIGSGVAATNNVTRKVNRLTQTFFPVLHSLPSALQWDVISRTVDTLENCGYVARIENRSDARTVSSADWKAANQQHQDVIDLLETKEDESKDFGTHPHFIKSTPERKTQMLMGKVKDLMTNEGLSREDAFQKIKETEPIFWAHSILSFDPKNGNISQK